MSRLSRTIVFALIGLAAGCGGAGKPNFGSPAPARGRVALAGGVSARGMRVVFTPTDGQGKQVDALVAADSTFALSTFAPKDGALPGLYVVTLDADGRTAKVPAKYAGRE